MTTGNDHFGWVLASIAGMIIFAAFTAWGGIPAETNIGLFWLQAGIFLLVICAFVLAFWHLLIRPLAPNLRQPQSNALTLRARQALALTLASGGIATFIGGVWDELWHRSYGLPFGEDLFWRPHLLMYFGFATATAAGFWALLYLNRQLRGNFQQRFRSNTAVGLLILNAAFLLYALPADPLWHWIFGEDITAWSIPHLILLTSFILTQLLALHLQASTMRPQPWRSLFGLRRADGLALLIIAAMQLLWLQLMLIDWDASLAGVPPESLGLYRPEWLLAANLLGCVTFTGVLATRLLRCAGAATAAGLLALVIRIGLIQLFDADMLQFVAWLAALLPLFAIDLWAYTCGVINKREPDWRGTAAAAIASMTINALVIRSLYNLGDGNNVAYAAAVLTTGLGASWFANRVADALLRQRKAAPAPTSDWVRIKPAASFGILGVFLVFIAFFIMTATPPV
ncbi:MAG: hypothetical protein OXE95_07255 [Chloroflexi bacterium]|nr:hypothetical protein [Chloroflexota bacterium]MCY4247353.1 hypothetical protein [Chloroflexota bacterium]